MRRLFLPLTIALFICSGISAQISEPRFRPVHFGIFPPISTNGIQAPLYTNGFSMHLAVGQSHGEYGLALAGGANIIFGKAYGIQIAGLMNNIFVKGSGIAVAGLANGAGDQYNGIMAAGISNKTGEMNGIQISGLTNKSKNLHGIQIAGLQNKAHNVYGIQVASFQNRANILGGMQVGAVINKVGANRGLQVSAGYNYARLVECLQIAGGANDAQYMNAVQMAGIVNHSRHLSGVQFAGLGNVAGHARGLQIAGLFNMAGELNGAQVAGLVNISGKVAGPQFALLLNMADTSDYPFALVNIIRDGEYGAGIQYSDLGSIVAVFRSGGKHSYGIIGAGYNHRADKGLTVTGGVGIHIDIFNRFRVNNEITASVIGDFSRKNSLYQISYAIMPAFKVFDRIEIYAGPTLNFLYTKNSFNFGIMSGSSLWDYTTESSIKQLSIGIQAGIQYYFKLKGGR